MLAFKKFRIAVLTSLLIIMAMGTAQAQFNIFKKKEAYQAKHHITSYPLEISKECKQRRAKIYDECSDQLVLFDTAMKQAKEEGKVLLVSYGAEWCIWCHVFNAYIYGQTDKFTYTYGEEGNKRRWTDTLHERAKHSMVDDAVRLNKFVSDNFIIVHIDYEHSPNGDDVLTQTNAWNAYEGNIPFVYTVDTSGMFAATFSHNDVEVRRDTDDWFRGYDRIILLEKLKFMHENASKK